MMSTESNSTNSMCHEKKTNGLLLFVFYFILFIIIIRSKYIYKISK